MLVNASSRERAVNCDGVGAVDKPDVSFFNWSSKSIVGNGEKTPALEPAKRASGRLKGGTPIQ